MKTINRYSILVVLLFASGPAHLYASEDTKSGTTPTAEAARAEVLINRLEEIKKMDMATLSRTEKKELRKEVRDTKKELKTNSRGVYISVGAAIIIVLLLVLLL